MGRIYGLGQITAVLGSLRWCTVCHTGLILTYSADSGSPIEKGVFLNGVSHLCFFVFTW